MGSGVELTEPVAGAGDGGDALGLAATDSGDGEDRSLELASCGIIRAEEQGRGDERLERRLARLQSKTRLNERSPGKFGESQEIGA